MSSELKQTDVVALIDKIYGTVTGECDWSTLTDEISRVVPFAAVSMHCYDLDNDDLLLENCRRWDHEAIDAFQRYYHDISPWTEGHFERLAGEVYTSFQVVTDLPGRCPEFYHDWAKRWGVGAGSEVNLFATESGRGFIALDYQYDRAEQFESKAVALLGQIAPHLQRSLEIRRKLGAVASDQRNFEILLGRSSRPAFLVAPDCKILWMNGAAENALGQNRGLQEANKRLKLALQRDTETLLRLVKEAAMLNSKSGQQTPGVFSFHAPNESAEPNIISVTPLPGAISNSETLLADLFSIGRRSLVTIDYRADKPSIPEHLLQRAFGLTKTEARAVKALAQDMTTSEVAGHLNISVHTARSHIKRALQKSRCSRQAELVRIATRLID